MDTVFLTIAFCTKEDNHRDEQLRCVVVGFYSRSFETLTHASRRVHSVAEPVQDCQLQMIR